MLRKSSKPYQIFNNYCVRTPLFSFSYYKKIIQKDTLDDNDFKEMLNNTIFREAVFLASPELYAQIVKWEKGDLLDLKKIEKLQFSILKYITRISTRCTPFGLFATCGVGEFGLDTNIQLNKTNKYKRHTRFDTTFLNQLFQELLKNPVTKENVLFYPNTSIYKIGNHYRYVEYTIEKKSRNYALEGLVYSEYLETILQEAQKGKTISELAIYLINDEITKEDAVDFINQLISNQILVSELELTVTGSNYFINLIKRVKQIPEVNEVSANLIGLQKQLSRLDTEIGNDIELYQSLIAEAKKFVPELDIKYLFQTDTFTSFKKNTLDNRIESQLKKAFIIFNKMTLPTANGNIERFKKDFLQRFEQSEVPLNLVLDTETGIGYGDKKEDSNELLDDLSLFGNKKRYERIIWTDVDSILQKKLVDATQNSAYTIKLTEDDFKELPFNNDDLPDTFSSIIDVYKIQNEEQIFINGMGGSSATCLLGRFGYGTEELEKLIKEIVDTEEKINNHKILAEILHLPEARTGNILQRPSFRKYEIPFLGKSNVAQEYQIPLEDILISVKNDAIILRSKKLQKEILPSLGNAHNYGANPLPIYQFLCELQTQNKRSSIGFSWNDVLKQQPFLPRVEFKNMIFSKALWSVEVKVFKKLFEKEDLMLSTKNWRKQNLIPSFVELVEGDNKLLINFNNKTSIKLLLDIVKNRKQFLLEEFLFNDNEIIKDKEGSSYCNQFVVSYYNEAKLKDAVNA